MNGKLINIEVQKHKDIFLNSLTNVRKGKGSVICVSGEGGFGKTNLLNLFLKISTTKESGVLPVYVLCDSPVGSFRVSNLQPMLPFSRAIEKILAVGKDEKTPEKRFARNIGMTVLATLPLAGEVFYAVKELSKDWRQYKKEKSSYSIKNINSVTTEYYDSLLSLSERVPIVLLLDDMHWCDAQSVELLNILTEGIEKTPLLIVFSYKLSILEAHNQALNAFIKNSGKSASVTNIVLKGFDKEQIGKYLTEALTNYRTSPELEDWLLSQTGGIPGALHEYIKYFEQNSPFTSEGTLKKDFFNNENLPSSFQSAFEQIVGNLNEDERNTLAICSSEGREFTAFIISQLLNTDVLTSIKKLRALQNKTGIIRSKGSRLRYGLKTTTYEFTQAFYHNLFEKSLEYEEYIDLHARIAGILKQRYEESESEFVRQELAPYIAAHSNEAGDSETAKSMLLLAARAAQRFGNPDVIKEFYENFTSISSLTESGVSGPEEEILSGMIQSFNTHEQENINGELSQTTNDKHPEFDIHDFNTIRNAIVEYLHKSNFTAASGLAVSYLDNHNDGLELSAVAQIYALAIMSFIGLHDLNKSDTYCRNALTLVEKSDDIIAECFIYNVCSIFYSIKKDEDEAQDYLSRIARKAMSLPPELKLLTLSNMALLMDKTNPKEAAGYFDAVRKISSELNFSDFAKDVFNAN